MADLLTEVKDRVLYLTLNRPDKLNAMSNEMMGGLVDNLVRAASNPEIGAVVVTGAGRAMRVRARSRRSRIASRDYAAAKRHRGCCMRCRR
jgi:enoyl-CoA hydratase/carnithine racemase